MQLNPENYAVVDHCYEQTTYKYFAGRRKTVTGSGLWYVVYL